jgi:hypothetical protein
MNIVPTCSITMQIYLFWSELDTKVFGLALDAGGDTLPIEFGPWSKSGQGEPVYVGPDESLTASIASNAIIQKVRRDGFYLARIGAGGESVREQSYYVTMQPEIGQVAPAFVSKMKENR